MSDFIRREDVAEALYQAIRTTLTGTFTDSMSLAIAMANNLPSAKPERKGKWIDDGTELGCCCSECGVTLDDYFNEALYEVRLGKMPNFCPNCGAKMMDENE